MAEPLWTSEEIAAATGGQSAGGSTAITLDGGGGTTWQSSESRMNLPRLVGIVRSGKDMPVSRAALPEMPTVEKVAAALNSLGVTPRDMMSMFQAMKQAGALQAKPIPRRSAFKTP